MLLSNKRKYIGIGQNLLKIIGISDIDKNLLKNSGILHIGKQAKNTGISAKICKKNIGISDIGKTS